MIRTVTVAALSAALLSAAGVASAAPATTLGKTYVLGCALNAQDGTALKVRMMIKNTTGRVIKQGTAINVYTYLYIHRYGRGGTPKTEIAYRDIGVNDSIGFDQRRGAWKCRATVVLKNENVIRTPR